MKNPGPVSYTHLDVYKRQIQTTVKHQQIGSGQNLNCENIFRNKQVNKNGLTSTRAIHGDNRKVTVSKLIKSI